MNKIAKFIYPFSIITLIFFIVSIVIIEVHKYSNFGINITELTIAALIMFLAGSFVCVEGILSKKTDKKNEQYKSLLFISYIQFYALTYIGLCIIDILVDIYKNLPVKSFIEYFRARGVIIAMIIALTIDKYIKKNKDN